jgi:hypothetical protein
MRIVVVVLFFAIAFAPQSVSLKLDADGAEFVAIATHSGVILTDSADCDDDYRYSHAPPILVAVEWASLYTRLGRLPEFSNAPRFYQIKTPLSKLHAVLRI